MKVSFQFVRNSALSQDSSSGDTEPIINSVESSSIESAINLMNVYIGKELNLSHCKVIVFSEEYAKSGISSTINTLVNNIQIRPSTNVIVSKCSADYYIANSSSTLESLVTRYYDIFPNSSNYTGYTANVTIGEFFNKMIGSTSQSTAILGGINTTKNTNVSKNDAETISNKSSISGERGNENIGLAVFNGDTLVGELNALETLCHLINTNDISSFNISIPNPNDISKKIDLSITPKKKTKVSIDIQNGSPYIFLNINLEGVILSVDDNIDYLEKSNLDLISSYANNYLKSSMSNYLYKTSKILKTDIDSFGKFATSKFLTEKDWYNYDWLNCYQDAFFDINIDTKIKSSQLLTET